MPNYFLGNILFGIYAIIINTSAVESRVGYSSKENKNSVRQEPVFFRSLCQSSKVEYTSSVYFANMLSNVYVEA